MSSTENVNNNNSSSRESTQWEEDTVKLICQMFDNKIDPSFALELLRKNGQNVEKTVDEMLNITLREAQTEDKPQEDILEEIIENSTPPLVDLDSSLPSVPSFTPLNPSPWVFDFTADYGQWSQDSQVDSISVEEEDVQTEEQEDDNEVDLQLKEALDAKLRVEEEKKSAMKWCLNEMSKLKEIVKEKDEVISRQEEELTKLRKQLEEKQADDKTKLDHYLNETKSMLVDGVHSLSQQINENISKVQKEFKNQEKEWAIIEKLKEFAAEFKKEMMDIFKAPSKPLSNSPANNSQKPISNEKEETNLWEYEKASLESYIEELEAKIKDLEDERVVLDESLFDSSFSLSNSVTQPLLSQPPINWGNLISPPVPVTPSLPQTQLPFNGDNDSFYTNLV